MCISFAVIGYLFGSIIFGAIISKITKKDIRNSGSKNIGGTNVSRILGMPIGILVSVLDALKGYLAVIICWVIFRYTVFNWLTPNTSIHLYPIIYIAGVFAVVGHCWPLLFLIILFKNKFDFQKAKTKSGGKGVSTTGGILFAISPWLGLIAFGTFVCVVIITRYVSLSSMICMFIPVFMIFIPTLQYIYLFDNSLLYTGQYSPNISTQIILMMMMLCNSSIIIVRHKTNIVRLLQHKEKRIF